MSHEINKSDNFGYVGQPAWHRLGRELQPGMSATDAFRELGIDWGTELAPIYKQVTKLNDDGMPMVGPEGPVTELTQIDTHFIHQRADTKQELGLVSAGYRPFENMDVARFCDELAGADAAVQIETAGTLYDCRRVFALVKLPEIVRASADDELAQYVLVANGHGGTASFSCYPTSVRVVCANTLRWSEKDAARGLSFRHTGKVDEKLAQVRQVLGIARQETTRFQDQVKAMYNKSLSKDEAREYITACWHIAFGSFKGLEGDKLAAQVARRDAQVDEQLLLMENEKNTIGGMGGTVWAALNAVTEFNDHVRGRTGEGSQVRVHSNLFGSASQAKTKSFRKALELV